jgi:hypothetical protein
MKLLFNFQNKSTFGQLQKQLSDTLCAMLAAGKDFSVKFDYDKTPKQHRGYFRLVDLLLPYLSKSYGEINNKDDADDFIRIESGYFKVVKTKNKEIVLPISIKTAAKEDLMRLINKAYEACEFYDIKDYELTSAETQALVEYFNKKEIK